MSNHTTTLNITRTRGDTFPMQFTLKDSSGTAIDITGFSFLMTVDPSAAPSDATGNLFQLTGTITDAVNGVFQFPISAMQADQTPGEYFHDVQMTDAGGFIRTIVTGTFTFEQDITK